MTSSPMGGLPWPGLMPDTRHDPQADSKTAATQPTALSPGSMTDGALAALVEDGDTVVLSEAARTLLNAISANTAPGTTAPNTTAPEQGTSQPKGSASTPPSTTVEEGQAPPQQPTTTLPDSPTPVQTPPLYGYSRPQSGTLPLELPQSSEMLDTPLFFNDTAQTTTPSLATGGASGSSNTVPQPSGLTMFLQASADTVPAATTTPNRVGPDSLHTLAALQDTADETTLPTAASISTSPTQTGQPASAQELTNAQTATSLETTLRNAQAEADATFAQYVLPPTTRTRTASTGAGGSGLSGNLPTLESSALSALLGGEAALAQQLGPHSTPRRGNTPLQPDTSDSLGAPGRIQTLQDSATQADMADASGTLLAHRVLQTGLLALLSSTDATLEQIALYASDPNTRTLAGDTNPPSPALSAWLAEQGNAMNAAFPAMMVSNSALTPFVAQGWAFVLFGFPSSGVTPIPRQPRRRRQRGRRTPFRQSLPEAHAAGGLAAQG
ncbi:superantigen-like protein SSL4 [Acetobacter vaccinii]|uniref:Uncharacterized protein n=1 Tax=Acetobacter vaccinii TaxID=2592655 RepID=A0A5C1YNL2_9PROT|nr:hypothetical protein [Acetobacter vaccinii]QEO17463.1 hypothetical protein FLP30_06810 [Acetobacter vaccinii]